MKPNQERSKISKKELNTSRSQYLKADIVEYKKKIAKAEERIKQIQVSIKTNKFRIKTKETLLRMITNNN